MSGRPKGTATQAARILALWRLLSEWHALATLADRCGVTDCTIRRDLAVLREVCGVDYDRETGRYRREDADCAHEAACEAHADGIAAALEIAEAIEAEAAKRVQRPGENTHAAGEVAAARRIADRLRAMGAT